MNFLANSAFTSLTDICLPESRLCPLMISDLTRVFCSNQHDRYLLVNSFKEKKKQLPKFSPKAGVVSEVNGLYRLISIYLFDSSLQLFCLEMS